MDTASIARFAEVSLFEYNIIFCRAFLVSLSLEILVYLVQSNARNEGKQRIVYLQV